MAANEDANWKDLAANQKDYLGKCLQQRYQFLERLGSGGMGMVYQAKDLERNILVAVKQIRALANMSPRETAERLRREHKFLNALDHPNIIKAYDFFEYQQSFFLVLELAIGISLQEFITQHRHKLPLKERVAIANQICRAVEVFNAAGIIHRDIKPANIIVNQETGQVKILDLGLGKSLGGDLATLTEQGAIVGTPAYLSPEQVNGGIDRRSDIFSLGITLYQLFLGMPSSPFKARSNIATMMNIAANDLPPLTEHCPAKISASERQAYQAISQWLEQALQKDPEQRLNSAGKLADALARIHQHLLAAAPDPMANRHSWELSLRLSAEQLEHLRRLGEMYGDDAVIAAENFSATASFTLESDHIEHYQILETIGHGSTGKVYKAKDTQLRRLVAIKIICGRADKATTIERFSREIQLSARLDHPHIIKIFHVGNIGVNPYMVTDYVHGLPLLIYLQRKMPPLADKLQLLAKIARAIDYAHQHNIIHRDIKPSNIMVRDNGEPVIMDFGLAKSSKDWSLTRSGEMVGTPQYMAPEQAYGKKQQIDIRTDVYGLGAVMYHLLVGRPPATGKSLMAILSQVFEGKPDLPRLLVPEIPKAVECICLKALNREKKQRYSSARLMAQDIDNYLAGKRVAAMPFLYPGKKIALALLLLLVPGMALWFYHSSVKTPSLYAQVANHYQAGKLANNSEKSYHEYFLAWNLLADSKLKLGAGYRQWREKLLQSLWDSYYQPTIQRLQKAPDHAGTCLKRAEKLLAELQRQPQTQAWQGKLAAVVVAGAYYAGEYHQAYQIAEQYFQDEFWQQHLNQNLPLAGISLVPPIIVEVRLLCHISNVFVRQLALLTKFILARCIIAV